MPPQYFVKPVHCNLRLHSVVNITHQATLGAKTVFYSFLFLTVSDSKIAGTQWMNERPPVGPSRVPKAIAVCRKIRDQLKKPAYLKTNPILAMGTCITHLLAPPKTGLRELLPWLPSRNGNGNVDSADIFGHDTTKRIKTCFQSHIHCDQTKAPDFGGCWKIFTNQLLTFPSSTYRKMKPGRLFIIHFKTSLQQPVLCSSSVWTGSHLGSLAVTVCFSSLSCCDRIPEMLMTESPATTIAHLWCWKEGKSLESHSLSLYYFVQWMSEP